MKKLIQKTFAMMLGAALLATPLISVQASSHSEAPLTARDRFIDNTDTYAFRSIEQGRENYVTIIANYIPFQQPSGGPHFFRWDDTAMYEIRIDNDGDGVEDVSYQFNFQTKFKNGDTILGQGAANQDVAITSLDDPDYNEPQTYSVRKIEYKKNKAGSMIAEGLIVPPSNIGPKVTPN